MWQPIETAPKDDDVWFLAIKGKIPFVTGWDTSDQCFYTFNLHYESDARKYGKSTVWQPTHWMPLPAPPTEHTPQSTPAHSQALTAAQGLTPGE